MSFDLWLYKSKNENGPISTWSKACYVSLGDWELLKAKICGKNHKSKDPFMVQSIIQTGTYEVHPNYSADGELEWLKLRGATIEDAKKLGNKLNLSVYNPQSGENILINT